DGIRADMNAGSITVGNIFEIMPFENVVCVLTLSGGDMQRLADYMAKTGGQPVSGIKLIIVNGKVKEFMVQGKQIDLYAHYKLVTNDNLANGGYYETSFYNNISLDEYMLHLY